MANDVHLNILKKGVEVWNEWRRENRSVKPNLSGAELTSADLTDADLSGVNLSGARLSWANLDSVRLISVNLSNAKLHYTNLFMANLSGANLSGADLQGACLQSANLSNANLSNANLESADLQGAILISAKLRDANLCGADLRVTYLRGANLRGASFGYTTLTDLDLSNATGLDTAHHSSPSSIGLDTFFKSKGKIPEVFLRGAGVPDIFLQYAASLAGTPLEFFSCFISYSTKDEAFVQQLYTDLQKKGVRCWFAPENLKIGDKVRLKIDEAIRDYEKLLIVLSQHAVQSDWVEKEIETAFEKERKGKRIVLFPIRLDDAVMVASVGWAADIRRSRHIGDFRKWKSHVNYAKAVERLLRDLKGKESKVGKPSPKQLEEDDIPF